MFFRSLWALTTIVFTLIGLTVSLVNELTEIDKSSGLLATLFFAISFAIESLATVTQFRLFLKYGRTQVGEIL